MGVIIPQVITPSKASGAQVIDGSLKFDPNSNHHLKRTPGSAGNRKTWTWSSWVKLNSISYQNLFANLVGNNNGLYVYWNTDGKLYINDYQLSGGANLSTTAVFRDLSSFYHFVIVFDTTQATASNRVKLYVNGSQLTLSSTFPNQNLDGQWNNTQTQFIGRQTDNVDVYDLDGSLSNIYFIDGQALTADSFGFTDPLTNTWKPKKYTGTFTGTNTFYLPFDGSAPIGKDQSGNGNDFTPVNFLGLQVFVSGSVNPKLSGVSAWPSMK